MTGAVGETAALGQQPKGGLAALASISEVHAGLANGDVCESASNFKPEEPDVRVHKNEFRPSANGLLNSVARDTREDSSAKGHAGQDDRPAGPSNGLGVSGVSVPVSNALNGQHGAQTRAGVGEKHDMSTSQPPRGGTPDPNQSPAPVLLQHGTAGQSPITTPMSVPSHFASPLSHGQGLLRTPNGHASPSGLSLFGSPGNPASLFNSPLFPSFADGLQFSTPITSRFGQGLMAFTPPSGHRLNPLGESPGLAGPTTRDPSAIDRPPAPPANGAGGGLPGNANAGVVSRHPPLSSPMGPALPASSARGEADPASLNIPTSSGAAGVLTNAVRAEPTARTGHVAGLAQGSQIPDGPGVPTHAGTATETQPGPAFSQPAAGGASVPPAVASLGGSDPHLLDRVRMEDILRARLGFNNAQGGGGARPSGNDGPSSAGVAAVSSAIASTHTGFIRAEPSSAPVTSAVPVQSAAGTLVSGPGDATQHVLPSRGSAGLASPRVDVQEATGAGLGVPASVALPLPGMGAVSGAALGSRASGGVASPAPGSQALPGSSELGTAMPGQGFPGARPGSAGGGSNTALGLGAAISGQGFPGARPGSAGGGSNTALAPEAAVPVSKPGVGPAASGQPTSTPLERLLAHFPRPHRAEHNLISSTLGVSTGQTGSATAPDPPAPVTGTTSCTDGSDAATVLDTPPPGTLDSFVGNLGKRPHPGALPSALESTISQQPNKKVRTGAASPDGPGPSPHSGLDALNRVIGTGGNGPGIGNTASVNPLLNSGARSHIRGGSLAIQAFRAGLLSNRQLGLPSTLSLPTPGPSGDESGAPRTKSPHVDTLDRTLSSTQGRMSEALHLILAGNAGKQNPGQPTTGPPVSGGPPGLPRTSSGRGHALPAPPITTGAPAHAEGRWGGDIQGLSNALAAAGMLPAGGTPSHPPQSPQAPLSGALQARPSGHAAGVPNRPSPNAHLYKMGSGVHHIMQHGGGPTASSRAPKAPPGDARSLMPGVRTFGAAGPKNGAEFMQAGTSRALTNSAPPAQPAPSPLPTVMLTSGAPRSAPGSAANGLTRSDLSRMYATGDGHPAARASGGLSHPQARFPFDATTSAAMRAPGSSGAMGMAPAYAGSPAVLVPRDHARGMGGALPQGFVPPGSRGGDLGMSPADPRRMPAPDARGPGFRGPADARAEDAREAGVPPAGLRIPSPLPREGFPPPSLGHAGSGGLPASPALNLASGAPAMQAVKLALERQRAESQASQASQASQPGQVQSPRPPSPDLIRLCPSPTLNRPQVDPEGRVFEIGWLPSSNPDAAEIAAFRCSMERHFAQTLGDKPPPFTWNNLPKLGREPVDLLGLYREVGLRGGDKQVQDRKWWKRVGDIVVAGGRGTTSLGQQTKSCFTKNLLSYFQRFYVEEMWASTAAKVLELETARKKKDKGEKRVETAASKKAKQPGEGGAAPPRPPKSKKAKANSASESASVAAYLQSQGQMMPMGAPYMWNPGQQQQAAGVKAAKQAQQQEVLRQKAILQAQQNEQASAILNHVGPAPGPYVVVPAGLEDRQARDLEMALLSSVPSEVSWALNVLGVTSFVPRKDIRLDQSPGILKGLVHVLEIAIGKAPPPPVVVPGEENAVADEPDNPFFMPPLKRRKLAAEPGAPEGWWWEEEAELVDEEAASERFTHGVCASNVLRNLSMVPENIAPLLDPKIISLLVQCLEERDVEQSEGMNELAVNVLDVLQQLDGRYDLRGLLASGVDLVGQLVKMAGFGATPLRIRKNAVSVLTSMLGGKKATSAHMPALIDDGRFPVMKLAMSLMLTPIEDAHAATVAEVHGELGPPDVDPERVSSEAICQAAYILQVETIKAGCHLLCLMMDKEMGERGLRMASNLRCVRLLVRVLTEAYPPPAPADTLMGPLKLYMDKQLGLLRQQAGYILNTLANSNQLAAIRPYELDIAQAAMRVQPAPEFAIAILSSLVKAAPPAPPTRPAVQRAPAMAAAGPLTHNPRDIQTLPLFQPEQGLERQNMQRQLPQRAHPELALHERQPQERSSVPQEMGLEQPFLDRALLERVGGGWGMRREDPFPMS